jgi:hypothetical protein
MNATFLNNFVFLDIDTLRKHKGRNSELYPFMVMLRLRSPGTSSLYLTPEYIRLFAVRNVFIFIFYCATDPSGPGLPQYRGFTLRHTTLTRSPLDKWSARSRNLYLITHNTQIDRRPFPQRDSNPQSQQDLDRAATGIGLSNVKSFK